MACDWCVGGIRRNRPQHVINSLYIGLEDLEAKNYEIFSRYAEAAKHETVWHEHGHEEPEILLCAYGISARVCETAVDWAMEAGVRARLLRPVSLFPFPAEPLAQWAEHVKVILVAELSMGQFVQDVRLAVEGRCPVELSCRPGGPLLTPEAVLERIKGLV
jgi:2-oxoglutarate ferredoxin oxidoreductase subunit alpha